MINKDKVCKHLITTRIELLSAITELGNPEFGTFEWTLKNNLEQKYKNLAFLINKFDNKECVK